MNAVQYVLDNVNPRKILEYYNFEHIVETEWQIRCCCAIHGGNNPTAFCWNKSNNLWYCYTGDCGGGDAITLVEKLDNLIFFDAVKKLASILSLDIGEMEITNTNDRIQQEQKHWLSKQKNSLKKLPMPPCELPSVKYYDECETFQRFDKELLNYYGAKFVKIFPTEKSMLYNKLVIPVKNEYTVCCVALRDTTGSSQMKWFYYPPVRIGDLLYNYDCLTEGIKSGNFDSVILVEGIFDVWAYHRIGIDNVVAIFGSSLKDEQKKKLLRLSIDFILSFDNDEAGIKCTKECKKLLKNYANISIVHLPKGKDPCDCTEAELINAYENRQKE